MTHDVVLDVAGPVMLDVELRLAVPVAVGLVVWGGEGAVRATMRIRLLSVSAMSALPLLSITSPVG